MRILQSHLLHGRSSGFSLIELAIVIVIIGVIAAIAVPRMSIAAERAADQRLEEDRRRLQAACNFYTAEHSGSTPGEGLNASSASTLIFVRRLVGRTHDDGTVHASGVWGPYMRSIPVNIVNNRRSVRVGGAAAGADTHGWRFDRATGEVQPDHAAGSSVRADESDTFENNVGDAIDLERANLDG